ncbi:unnamed protein product [Ceratitis capitata]|uniref:(Mediterranean fruit fly) hypothetical protein n=1 Tax=Ceratitis capitata TaxID=7213 RepID=A0A811UP56_CERCA|nr:unnamed protein product [Ceratitis capitata]
MSAQTLVGEVVADTMLENNKRVMFKVKLFDCPLIPSLTLWKALLADLEVSADNTHTVLHSAYWVCLEPFQRRRLKSSIDLNRHPNGIRRESDGFWWVSRENFKVKINMQRNGEIHKEYRYTV